MGPCHTGRAGASAVTNVHAHSRRNAGRRPSGSGSRDDARGRFGLWSRRSGDPGASAKVTGSGREWVLARQPRASEPTLAPQALQQLGEISASEIVFVHFPGNDSCRLASLWERSVPRPAGSMSKNSVSRRPRLVRMEIPARRVGVWHYVAVADVQDDRVRWNVDGLLRISVVENDRAIHLT